MNFPDDINTYLMDRSQASKRLRYSEIQELVEIDKAIKTITEAVQWSDDPAALNDAMASLVGRKQEIED